MIDEAYSQEMYGGSHPNLQFELDCRSGKAINIGNQIGEMLAGGRAPSGDLPSQKYIFRLRSALGQKRK